MTQAREITISVAAVSPELTTAAGNLILRKFGGYFRATGFGGYTYADGRTIEESSVQWRIATAESAAIIRRFISIFACAYCAAGNQESVYFADVDGSAFLADSAGILSPLTQKES